jgi:hypothetical protein
MQRACAAVVLTWCGMAPLRHACITWHACARVIASCGCVLCSRCVVLMMSCRPLDLQESLNQAPWTYPWASPMPPHLAAERARSVPMALLKQLCWSTLRPASVDQLVNSAVIPLVGPVSCAHSCLVFGASAPSPCCSDVLLAGGWRAWGLRSGQPRRRNMRKWVCSETVLRTSAALHSREHRVTDNAGHASTCELALRPSVSGAVIHLPRSTNCDVRLAGGGKGTAGGRMRHLVHGGHNVGCSPSCVGAGRGDAGVFSAGTPGDGCSKCRQQMRQCTVHQLCVEHDGLLQVVGVHDNSWLIVCRAGSLGLGGACTGLVVG